MRESSQVDRLEILAKHGVIQDSTGRKDQIPVRMAGLRSCQFLLLRPNGSSAMVRSKAARDELAEASPVPQ